MLSSVVCQSIAPINFTLQTSAAAFGPRWWASVESYPKAITANGFTLPANSLILFGGSTNTSTGESYYGDVWGSSDNGVTWRLIADNAFPGTRFPGYTIDSQARLYKVAGSDGSDVYMSTNGVSWQQQTPGSTVTTLPGRTFPDVQVDSKDTLYVVAGLSPTVGGGGLNDVWKSTDQGRNWVRSTNMPFPQPPGRSSGFLIHKTSRQTKQDVLTYMGGYGRVQGNASSVVRFNDVYLSTDNGAKWLLVTANAPWSPRNNFNAEVTRDGAIVIVAGFNDIGGDTNDVWVSLDGGWTWGQCVEDSPWTDRRWVSTVLDNDGYLLLIGGDERNANNGPRIPRNDVWRSSFSLNDNTALSRACGVPVPSCGVGLTCTPSDTTKVEDGRVTCPAARACASDNLAFTVTVATAPWPVRHTPGVEFLKSSVRVGGVLYNTPGSMVLYGGTGPNEQLMTDSWISSNSGLTWTQVPTTGNGFAGSAWSGHIIDNDNRIYKIGGERWGPPANTGNGEVYVSTNAGVTWAQQRNTTRTNGLPPRSFADTYVDAKNNIYIAGGLEVGGPGLNDVWVSSDQGRTWKLQGRIPFITPGGRSSASLLLHSSKVLQKDIMYYFGGYSRGNGQETPLYHNDVYVSSDLGKSWKMVTAAAPWTERDNFNAEITEDGLIVFAGGLNSREALNDVWVSADGGYTWGLCVAEAQFTDRRWHATAMDKSGFLYLVGGEEYEHGQYVKKNDVWRSSMPFQATSATTRNRIAKACGITYPQCNAGLSCWPGTQRIDAKGQVSCTLYNAYKSNGCSSYDPENPDTWGSSGSDDGGQPASTGVPDSGSSLSIGLIALIVVLVLAGVLGIAGYFFYQRKQQASQNVIPGIGTDGLLLGAGQSTDSSTEGAATDYYAQQTHSTA